MNCIQCQSTKIVQDIRCVDRGHGSYKHDLKLEVDAYPDAWIFKHPQEGTLRANVCVDCGFVMFNVSLADAKKLEQHKR